MKEFYIEYYGEGCFLNRVWVYADNKQKAIEIVRNKYTVVSIKCCKEI